MAQSPEDMAATMIANMKAKTGRTLVQPSTRSRVDLGINLKNKPAQGRLESAGSFNAMVSHRVRLETAADVDGEVKAWLQAAYSEA